MKRFASIVTLTLALSIAPQAQSAPNLKDLANYAGVSEQALQNAINEAVLQPKIIETMTRPSGQTLVAISQNFYHHFKNKKSCSFLYAL